jgi:glycosyltransferase involved in cell wall biosynthesis
MKILIVSNFLSNTVGGVENYLQTLVSYTEKHSTALVFEWFGVENRKTKMHQKFYNAETTQAICAAIDSFQPDLIHSFSIGATVTPHFMAYAKKKNIPILQSFHDYYYICPKGAMLDLQGNVLEKHSGILDCVLHHQPKRSVFYDSVLYLKQQYHKAIINKNSAYFLTPSANLTTRIAAAFKIEGETLPNPVVLSNSLLLHLQTDYLLFVGRLEQEKGVLTLLKAFEQVVQKYPNEQLKIVGSGSFQSAAALYVAANKINNVTFLGAKNQEELQPLYAAAKFVIIPSEILESYGNVILESFAFNKTVIISNLLGIQREVAASNSGLVFPYKNVEKLTASIEKLLSDIDLRTALEQNATRYIKDLSFENHFKNLLAIYQKVVKKYS